MSQGIRAFILGYTGESGKELVKACSNDSRFSKIILIGRREVALPEGSNASHCEQVMVDFEKLEEHREAFADSTVGYCCLGTTRGKSGAAGFVKVDKDYCLKAAEVAHQAGCTEFHYLSSQGANKNSMVLYSKTKGEVEDALAQSGWFRKLVIYRPGVLMCNRQESRPAEAIFRFLLKPLASIAPSLITTSTEDLAKAMVEATFRLKESPAHPLNIAAILDLTKPPHQ